MALTPMLEQYWQIKKLHEDALLLFRLGDFYELFDEDARKAAPVLDITLTARNRNTPQEIAMCGIPHHSANSYIVKLVKEGYKVAICDQVSDPNLPGIVERTVTRVITPGSIDLIGEEQKGNTFTTSIFADTQGFHLATMELTSGLLKVTSIADLQTLTDEITRIRPAEIILPEQDFENNEFKSLKNISSAYVFPFAQSQNAYTVVTEQFGVNSLRGFGLEDEQGIVEAVALLITYIKEHQHAALKHIHAPSFYSAGEYVQLDKNAIEHLDLFENKESTAKKATLFDLLNETETPQGERTLKEWISYPLRSVGAIQKRLAHVEYFASNQTALHSWKTVLSHIGDFEKVIGKIHLKRAQPRQIRALADWFYALNDFPELPSSLSSKLKSVLQELIEIINTVDQTMSEEPSAVLEKGGVIKPSCNTELQELIDLSSGGKAWLAEFEQREKEKTGISTLKVRFNKVFGYFIEISKANATKAPEDYIRKQTLTNAERYINQELKEKETEILESEERALLLEKELFEGLCNKILPFTEAFQNITRLTAEIDLFTTFAHLARTKHYVAPEFHEDLSLNITNGRHPVLEQVHLNKHFTPHTIELSEKNRFMLITGPNMGGKSTVLRELALIQIMGQIGSFVPAEKATLFPVDRIFTRIGSSDALTENASTFMVEMEETSRILHGATKQSLVILDELGRGTSTYDGLSLAWAISEYLYQHIACFTLFATHYHELIHVVGDFEHASNYHMDVAEQDGSITFLYCLKEGGASQSYGIEVASLAGVPDAILDKAKTILNELESGTLTEDHAKHTFSRNTDYTDQLQLFSQRETALEQRIKSLDVEHITPMEALNELHDIKKKLGLDK